MFWVGPVIVSWKQNEEKAVHWRFRISLCLYHTCSLTLSFTPLNKSFLRELSEFYASSRGIAGSLLAFVSAGLKITQLSSWIHNSEAAFAL